MRVTGSSHERKLIISHNAENQIRNRKGTHLSHFAGAVPRNQDYQQKALEAENHLVGRMGKGRMTRESDRYKGQKKAEKKENLVKGLPKTQKMPATSDTPLQRMSPRRQ